MQPDNFSFDVECDFFEKAKPGGGSGRFIGGFVSTDHMDRQGETLIQEGLDFAPFLKGGWINDNHDKATDALVGYPLMAELRELPKGKDGIIHKGWYFEGELLEDCPRADSLWRLAKALEKSGSGRKLGYSVEGGVTKRDAKDPKIVRKAVVREVAITRCPVNTEAGLSVLAKSLSVSAGSTSGSVPGEAIAGSVNPLQPEALERKKKRKRIKKSVAITLLQQLHPQVSAVLATRIVDYTERQEAAA